MENIRFGNGEDGQIPFKEEKEKKKRGRPRKSEQVIRIVKKKKELHSQTTEDDVWKLKETSGANPEKQLLMKGEKTNFSQLMHLHTIKKHLILVQTSISLRKITLFSLGNLWLCCCEQFSRPWGISFFFVI